MLDDSITKTENGTYKTVVKLYDGDREEAEELMDTIISEPGIISVAVQPYSFHNFVQFYISGKTEEKTRKELNRVIQELNFQRHKFVTGK